jgi:Fe-Mn family superoxide dismutase
MLELPELPYGRGALEPHISEETLEYHYGKHHNAYVMNGNILLKSANIQVMKVEDLIRKSYAEHRLRPLFNNVSQHWNHLHFWNWMKPGGGGTDLPERLAKKINSDLGSFESFAKEFVQKGFTQFGSGWVWLSWAQGRLVVESTPNGENPLTLGHYPLLGCDVWEHSYYIDYRNDRRAYLESFLENLVNWDYVAERLDSAI